MTIKVAGRFATVGVVLALMTIGSRAEEITLPTFDVVATTPLGGGQINVSQSPFAVWQTSSQDTQTFNDTTLPDTLARSAPGVTVGNVSGNEFEPDLFYRGFDATAVTGTPQGLAVYQNGTRINEAFGDVVNWDLIPANRDRQDDDHRRKPDLRPQRARRRRHRDDEERLHLAGFRSRFRGRLVRARARANSVRQAVRQLVGLCGGHSDQRRRLAGRRSVAAHQLLRRRRLQGERV